MARTVSWTVRAHLPGGRLQEEACTDRWDADKHFRRQRRRTDITRLELLEVSTDGRTRTETVHAKMVPIMKNLDRMKLAWIAFCLIIVAYVTLSFAGTTDAHNVMERLEGMLLLIVPAALGETYRNRKRRAATVTPPTP